MHHEPQFQVVCEWGLNGISLAASDVETVVIVDVLSFSTAVDVAVGRGALVKPAAERRDQTAVNGGPADWVVADRRDGTGFSLSPNSLLEVPAGLKLVLPSPNGSTLSTATGGKTTITCCLRNRMAVASWLSAHTDSVAVVPAGERWTDGTLRPAIEDWFGAGALISMLSGSKSPEAVVAERVFRSTEGVLASLITQSVSGRELITRGFRDDVALASQLDCSRTVPLLVDGVYVDAGLPRAARLP